MSTRENIRLIARGSLNYGIQNCNSFLYTLVPGQVIEISNWP